MANRQKPSTLAYKEHALRVHILPTLGDRALDEVSTSDVQRLKASMASLKPKTCNNVLTTLATLLKAARKSGAVDRGAALCEIEKLKTHHGERPFHDFLEYERLVEAAAAIDPRIHLVVLLGGEGGLRMGEVIALRWSNVLLDRRSLRVAESDWRGNVTLPKGGRSREVPLTERLFSALKAHRHLRSERVLCRDDGKPTTARVLRRWMERAERRAGLEVTGRVHILRHSFCSHLAIKGAPARAIQELAGHADLTTTMLYMHLSPAARVSAIHLLDARPGDAAAMIDAAVAPETGALDGEMVENAAETKQSP